MYTGQSLYLKRLDNGIVELCFDRQGESINKFDVRTINELKAATQVLRAASDVQGVLVTSAKDAFIVGADIFEFASLFKLPAVELEAYIADQASVFTEFDDLPFPTVTAINGFALGGGFEMTLASDYRVMASTAQVGLPEVGLGIFPAYGGTVRLPRLIGAELTIDWISSSKPQTAAAALAARAVDNVVEPAELRASALDLLRNAIANATEWRARRNKRHGTFAANTEIFTAARAKFLPANKHLPAALIAVELLQQAAVCTRDEAIRLEAREFAKVAKTQGAASLVRIFINDQALKKKGKTEASLSRPIKRAAVLGAGIMGGGIAYTTAVRKTPVIMKDIAQKALDLGTSEASNLLARQVQTGRLDQTRADAVLASIKPQLDYSEFDSVDVVVEAVVENINVKRTVLKEVEAVVRPDTVLASNTSSLVIADMANVLQRPENMVGMHFFNPVPLMPLVEVIRGPQTSAIAAATIAMYARAMGKTPIVVRDCPGFLVNRIFTPYTIGFLHLLRDGADFIKIDQVMEKFGWPMGPAYLQDVIGIDTAAHVFDTISAGYGARMQMQFKHALTVLAELNHFGQKSQRGFYRYEADAKGRSQKLIADDTKMLLQSVTAPARDFSETEIIERTMLPMIIEAVRCLEEGVADSAAEIDTALLLGLGFPRYLGGPLQYADWLGLKHIVARCEQYRELGPLYVPTERMVEMAASGKTFY
jgi:3-hydroxyacyl-CoA dehydrogenase/enoyl-CoA hydratase/3-hydroxybutyryl-CoA epimerase/enoyl-CoA isomerase